MNDEEKNLSGYVIRLHELFKPLCWQDIWRVIQAYITLTKPESKDIK